MSSFVLSIRDEVSSENKFGVRIGSVSYLQVPDDATEPMPSHKVGDVRQWLDGIVGQANPPGTTAGKELDIVFFVHGYNTDAKEALVRQRLVRKRYKNATLGVW